MKLQIKSQGVWVLYNKRVYFTILKGINDAMMYFFFDVSLHKLYQF